MVGHLFCCCNILSYGSLDATCVFYISRTHVRGEIERLIDFGILERTSTKADVNSITLYETVVSR